MRCTCANHIQSDSLVVSKMRLPDRPFLSSTHAPCSCCRWKKWARSRKKFGIHPLRALIFSHALYLASTVAPASANWIDPDTPKEAYTTEPRSAKPFRLPQQENDEIVRKKKTHHTFPPTESPTSAPTYVPTTPPKTFELIMSDEFNTPHRTFEDGVDPKWTAIEKNDYTNDALHYYSAANVETNEDGELVITTEAAETEVIGFDDVNMKKTHITKKFRSGMLQTWNKFCFTGGIIEAEVQMPGKHDVGGLWPAFWMLGNLARHTYVGSSEHVWPWSSTKCSHRSRDAQLISGCSNVAHYGLQRGIGRGAPEIDIFEVQPGNIKANHGPFLKMPVGQPFMSSSYQVAPGRHSRPGEGWWPGPGQWYSGLSGGNATSLNILFYGTYNHFLDDVDPARQDYWSDAISYNRQLDKGHFTGKHKYRLEWAVPDNTTDGYLHWFLDNELVLAINGTGITEAGEGSEISSEPMYILLNTAISSQWGFPLHCPSGCKCKEFDCHATTFQKTCGFSEGFCDMVKKQPPQYKINYVRVYQDKTNDLHKVGCSTPERPTRRFIEAHEHLYKQGGDARPLKGIQRGRGRCDPGATGLTREACGGSKRGRCTKGKVCECAAGWAGPHCLAHDGFNPVTYDTPDQVSDLGFSGPAVKPLFLIVSLAVILTFICFVCIWKKDADSWTPIPEATGKFHIERYDSFN